MHKWTRFRIRVGIHRHTNIRYARSIFVTLNFHLSNSLEWICPRDRIFQCRVVAGTPQCTCVLTWWTSRIPTAFRCRCAVWIVPIPTRCPMTWTRTAAWALTLRAFDRRSVTAIRLTPTPRRPHSTPNKHGRGTWTNTAWLSHAFLAFFCQFQLYLRQKDESLFITALDSACYLIQHARNIQNGTRNRNTSHLLHQLWAVLHS